MDSALGWDLGRGPKVEATPTGWQAEIRLDGDEPRTLAAASCEDVMVAAMVVIAMARDAQSEPEPEGVVPVLTAPVVPSLASGAVPEAPKHPHECGPGQLDNTLAPELAGDPQASARAASQPSRRL